jgi:hypothetical protein
MPASEANDAEPCPLCGSADAAPARRLRIGRAFEECWRCGRRVERPGVTEWDFHPRGARRRIVLGRVAFVLAGGLVVPLAHLGVALTTPRAWTARDAGLALAAGWLAVGIWEAARLLGEVQRSRRRVSVDPMYRARLVELGITESRGDRDAVSSSP